MQNPGKLFENIQELADCIRADVEKQLNQSFKQFKVLEHEALKDPENTSYYMKLKTDDNGHVKVKTTRHPAGGEWKTEIQEYDKGQALGDRGRAAPIENKEKSTAGTANP